DSNRPAKCDINAARKDQANGQDLDKVSLAQVSRRGTQFCKFVGVRSNRLNDLRPRRLFRFANRTPTRRNAVTSSDVTHHLSTPTRAKDRNILDVFFDFHQWLERVSSWTPQGALIRLISAYLKPRMDFGHWGMPSINFARENSIEAENVQ